MRAMKSQGLNTSKLRWILGFIPERQLIECPELLDCILSAENGLRMMYLASRFMSSRLRGGTRWLRWMY